LLQEDAGEELAAILVSFIRAEGELALGMYSTRRRTRRRSFQQAGALASADVRLDSHRVIRIGLDFRGLVGGALRLFLGRFLLFLHDSAPFAWAAKHSTFPPHAAAAPPDMGRIRLCHPLRRALPAAAALQVSAGVPLPDGSREAGAGCDAPALVPRLSARRPTRAGGCSRRTVSARRNAGRRDTGGLRRARATRGRSGHLGPAAKAPARRHAETVCPGVVRGSPRRRRLEPECPACHARTPGTVEVPALGGGARVAHDFDVSRVAAAEPEVVREADELEIAQRIEPHELGGDRVDPRAIERVVHDAPMTRASTLRCRSHIDRRSRIRTRSDDRGRSAAPAPIQ
jgi:hypothetical protein